MFAVACGSSGTTPERNAAGFELTVLPTSFELGGSADFELKVADKGNLLQVEVVATDARVLKAAYLDLAYDTSRFTPLGAQSTHLLADGSGKQLVELAVTGQPGKVHHGQVLARPQSSTGFSGSGAVAIFTFAKQALPRTVAAAPDRDSSKTELSWASAGSLTWRFCSTGDYDQNGEVNISDLTPLAIRLGSSSGGGAFPFESIGSVADGDLNGEINIADISPIGGNLGNSLRKYLVYTSASEADYPASNAAASTVPVLGEVAVDDTQDAPNQARVSYSFVIPSPAEGAYYWVRPADTADAPGTPSNSVQYFAPNLSPIASLSAGQNNVPLGTTVTFDASGSSDPDGSIVKYEYDWDGNGTGFDWEDLGLNTAPTHQFNLAGSHLVRVRVTDNLGATGTAQTVIDVQDVQAPTADLTADVTSGDAPLAVTFDAGGSTDDGSIVKYEWDFDGDGTFETDSGTTESAYHEYASDGTFQAAVRVTDDLNLTDTASLAIEVAVPTGAPTAVIDGTPLKGTIPLTVDFDGSQSTDNGLIVKYEWDFDGDGNYDRESTPSDTTQFEFGFEGAYQSRLRVTDDQGLSGTAGIQVTAYGPGVSGARALLLARPRYGPVPLTVNFDASQSYSTDGAITSYEWDWDGDGTYDDSGTDGTVSHEFLAVGSIDTRVRVTDENADQDEAVMLVLVTGDDTFPPADSVFALPSQSFCQPGEEVGIEIYCKGSVSPLQYITGLRMTMPAGNNYVPMSFNVGVFGGASAGSTDGLWTQMNPSGGFLLPPDSFIQVIDIGGGNEAIDVGVFPLGGSDLLSATGAMCNFKLAMNADSSFGFQRFDAVSRTYYYDGNQSPEYYWANENVPGLPGVDVQ